MGEGSGCRDKAGPGTGWKAEDRVAWRKNRVDQGHCRQAKDRSLGGMGGQGTGIGGTVKGLLAWLGSEKGLRWRRQRGGWGSVLPDLALVTCWP